MAKQQHTQAANTQAANSTANNGANAQSTVQAAQHTVSGAQTLRARRLALVQTTLYAKRKAAKQAAHNAAQQAYTTEQQRLANMQAYQLQVQQLAQQYGINVQHHVAPRANSATVVPSANQVLVNGAYYTPCKAVHALAAIHQNRKATLAACKEAGINPATAATQYGVWKKQQSN